MDHSNGRLVLPPNEAIAARIKRQQLQSQPSKPLSTFYRNLEEGLDIRRASNSLFSIAQNAWQVSNAIDLCSGDILSFNASGALRAQFINELARFPDFCIGSGGVRLGDGNYPYLEQAEREIASFHGAEAGLIVGSAFEANMAVWTAIPRLGDVIVYDEFVHASTHEGIKQSLAMQALVFSHNDVESFRNVLLSILESQPLVKQGKRSVIVALESIYSMDGDVCPLQELIDAAKDIFNDHGNIQFVIDEAHSVGVIGPNGAGLVCELGLEKEIAVVVHSYGKAMGATGAIILGNETIKTTLVNFSRSVIYTTSPSFPFVAAISSGYALLKTRSTLESRNHIQWLARLFYQTITSHRVWPVAQENGLLSIPLSDGWEDRPFLTHIVTISTRQNYIAWLYFHLVSSSFCVFPVEYPIVPLSQGRLRVIFHANNTEGQIRDFIGAIFEWIEEMTEIEGGRTGIKVPKAAREVYAWMKQEGLSGCGIV